MTGDDFFEKLDLYKVDELREAAKKIKVNISIWILSYGNCRVFTDEIYDYVEEREDKI